MKVPKQVFTLLLLVAAGIFGFVTGCKRGSSEAVPSANAALPAVAVAPSKPEPLTPEQLEKFRPNEAGVVPILEYHEISSGKNAMCRSLKDFRRDLEWLYKNDFRPITLQSYVENRIDLPPGKSPVILTFDDARGSQFRYLPDGTIDPDCAVGVLQAFAEKRPDFPVRGVFFILAEGAFGQTSTRARKIQALLDMGCEIGNHTVRHRLLNRLSDQEVQREIAEGAKLIKDLAPTVEPTSLALPGGVLPRNRRLLASGKYKDWTYTNQSVFLAGAEPAPSPVSKKYNPMQIPRVLAVEGFMGVTYWLNYLKNNPFARYISDGDPETVTIPRDQISEVDKKKLQGATLRLY